MGATEPQLVVEVVYALVDEQVRHRVTLPPGSTIQEAILASGITRRFPEIELATCRVGVFGRRRALGTILNDADRVEIYRPLLAHPKDARHARAKKAPSRTDKR